MLLDDEVRSDAARWQPLVHPDFFQFGYGGSEVRFADLQKHWRPLGDSVDMQIVSCEPLGHDVMLLLWKGHGPDGVVNRAAVWVKSDTDWQLRYQQGTKA